MQLATGFFVHIKQGVKAQPAYKAWSRALAGAFKAVCDTGMRVGSVTN